MAKKDISVFIGSSSEDMHIVEEIKRLLEEDFEIIPWYKGVFNIGQFILDELVDEALSCDFAILVFSGNDSADIRGEKHLTPRDNVIFELGLFIGIIGRERTFMFIDTSIRVKTPTDTAGITWQPYDKNLLEETLEPACFTIKQRIKKLKGRPAKEPYKSIIKNALAIQKIDKPYPIWIFDWLVKAFSKSILSFKQGIELIDPQNTAMNYLDRVDGYLNAKQGLHSILALCGGKFQDSERNKAYFRKFYDFAGKELKDGFPKVCRIFIEKDERGFTDEIRPIVEEHKDERKKGTAVLALTIGHDKREDLNTLFGENFCTELDKGIGFLLFFTPFGLELLIHQGIDSGFSYFTLKGKEDMPIILQMFQMFELLCKESKEYLPGDEKEKIKGMLNNLRPSYI